MITYYTNLPWMDIEFFSDLLYCKYSCSEGQTFMLKFPTWVLSSQVQFTSSVSFLTSFCPEDFSEIGLIISTFPQIFSLHLRLELPGGF